MVIDLENQFENDNFKEKIYNVFLINLLNNKAKKYFEENSLELLSVYEDELKEKIIELFK